MLPGVAGEVCVGFHDGKEAVAGRSKVGSQWVDVGDVEKEGAVEKGIAGSPGAVNTSPLDIDPAELHEFSMSKNECWALGAVPGSPVRLSSIALAPKS
jgi:hypothetical protein